MNENFLSSNEIVISSSLERYIKRLYRLDKTGKWVLSLVCSSVVSAVLYVLFKNPGRLISLENDVLVSVGNLVKIFVFFLLSFVSFGLLFIWRPKKNEFQIYMATIPIKKIGNQYTCPYGALFVPYPWLRLIEDGTVTCLLGKWKKFSLTYKGPYLLGIPDMGFEIDKHENAGFFKYKGMPTLLLLSMLAFLTFLCFIMFIVNGEYLINVMGGFSPFLIAFFGITSFSSSFTVLFLLIRNYIIKKRIKAISQFR